MNNTNVHATLAILLAALLTSDMAHAQTPAQGPVAEERGVATSMFATYIGRRELIVYPFFEHYRDGNFEYKPEELGFAGATDFRETSSPSC